MRAITDPKDWPVSATKTIAVHPQNQNARPVGFADWPVEEKPRAQESDGRPSAHLEDGAGLLIRRPPARLSRRDQPSAGPGESQ